MNKYLKILNNYHDDESPAFCINDTFYSYKELLRTTSHIIYFLISPDYSKKKAIGVFDENNILTYASMLACWFSGKAYIPLTKKNPVERNRRIIEDGGIDTIFTCEFDIVNSIFGEKELNCIDLTKLDKGNGRIELQEIDENQKAYILFTSGSTGLPKGVPITFKNLASFIDSFNDLNIKINQNDRCIQIFDLSFDVSVASFLLPLINKACVYTIPTDGLKYLNTYNVLEKYSITYAVLVPSILNMLRTYFGSIKLPNISTCILTAEASNAKLIQEWSTCIPNAEIINLYGPTEATIWCTCYRVNVNNIKSYNDMLIIGKCFNGVKYFILDEKGEETEINEKGEFCISSNQLTSGYLNNFDKNASQFFEMGNEVFYRTGDLCFLDAEGDIYYCGRIDHQVKVQGYRIELSEIEKIVQESFNINCVAIAYNNESGNQGIALFVVDYKGEIEELKYELKKYLAFYMNPNVIINVKELPINTSGKTDRGKLLTFLSIA